MNKKGATLVELIVSFVIISLIAVSMFRTVLILSDKLIAFKESSDYKVLIGNVTNLMYQDLLNKGFDNVVSCGSNCYTITFGDATTKNISINKNAETINYGNNAFKLTKNIDFNGNLYYTNNTDTTTPASYFNSTIKFGIPLINSSTTITSEIPIVYQYYSKPIPIITNDLVLLLDAGNSSSYPGTGTVWNDISGNAFVGTMYNGITYNTSNGGNLVFNGTNNYVDLGTSTILKPSSFTFAAWIKFSTSQSGRMIMGYHSDALGGAGMGIDDTSANKIKLHTNNYTSPNRITSTITLNDNVWHYVVGRYTKTNIALFIDGVYNTSIIGAVAPTANANAFQIGKWAGGSQYFAGSIGYVSIYRRALSDDEIKQNFAALRGRYGV